MKLNPSIHKPNGQSGSHHIPESGSSQLEHQTERNAWIDCLSNDAPTDVDSGTPAVAHPLAQACTPKEYLNSLVKTIENNILPHIIEHHLQGAVNNESEIGQFKPLDILGIDPKHINILVELLLKEDATASAKYVRDLVIDGIELEEIYLNLLTPVARNLGERWDNDDLDFTQSTIALWRIKQLMYDLSPVFQEYAQDRQHGKNVMLVPLPGSQHTLGLFMVSEFFVRAGWRVWGELAATQADIIQMAKSQWFDIVGLSASVREQFPDLKEMIAQVRSVSLNPNVGIMIGSPVFNQNPDLIDDLGADMVGIDAVDALDKATKHVDKQVSK